MKTRRQLLTTAALFPILPASAADAKPKFFTPAERKLLASLTDIIIPRSDTPGASDAGVPLFIDHTLAAQPSRRQPFRDALKRFQNLSTPQQTALLQQLHDAKDPFFKTLKDLTIDGYYTSREGLAQELGWHGQTMLPEFKGCTHPEHKP
ncbi:MAG: gluconate 2-dehydrogenase subunit 3 family protein [Acidimicrobiia bacterium]|nr:gluconate 2-dehydrogenase subunit 3 family protein [Acidimicrobiia bacterium]